MSPTEPRVVDHPLAWYVERIERGEPFTFSRWGDGEWRAVLRGHAGGGGHNCDGHRYWSGMCRELAAVFDRRPPYILGMQSMALRMFRRDLPGWLAARDLADVEWHNADVLHYASIHQQLSPFVRAIRKHPLILVGPKYLKQIGPSLFRPARFVRVPDKNCYLDIDRIERDVRQACQDIERPVISFSASMTTEILLDRLFPELGQRAWMIDCGSLWDPFAGKKTRRYHRLPGVGRLKEKPQ